MRRDGKRTVIIVTLARTHTVASVRSGTNSQAEIKS